MNSFTLSAIRVITLVLVLACPAIADDMSNPIVTPFQRFPPDPSVRWTAPERPFEVGTEVKAAITIWMSKFMDRDWRSGHWPVRLTDELDWPNGTDAVHVMVHGFRFKSAHGDECQTLVHLFFARDDAQFLLACSDAKVFHQERERDRLPRLMEEAEWDVGLTDRPFQANRSFSEVLFRMGQGGIAFDGAGFVVVRTRFGSCAHPAIQNEEGELVPLLTDRFWWLAQGEGVSERRGNRLFLLDDKGGVPEWNDPWSITISY